MKHTKVIVRVAMCVAMLIGGQVALHSVSGVEIVTLLMLCFCFCFGIREGVAIALVFSLLRCIIFGFYPNVVILYLVFYPLFALFFGWLGKLWQRKLSMLRVVITVLCAVAFTLFFTLLDNTITPLLHGLNAKGTWAYMIASLYTVVPQVICTLVTVSLFFVPLTKILKRVL